MTRLTAIVALMLCAHLACRRQSYEPPGRQMEIQIDAGRHANDVAFWLGTAPNDVLAVIARDARTGHERASGAPAERAIRLPMSGVVTVRGTLEPVPDAEATYGWGLTRADVERLSAKGVYLRLHTVVH